jgi:hypothetical protein
MFLRSSQRLRPATVHLIGEECGMNFTLPLQPYEETVRAV